MTLVVGRIVGPRVAIAADTMLTKQDKSLPFQNGVVKSCMLPGDLCVSFCNSPDTAGRAFKEFAAKYPNGADYAEVMGFFEQSSEATGNDYLVAFANPARLIKIANGKHLNSVRRPSGLAIRMPIRAFENTKPGTVRDLSRAARSMPCCSPTRWRIAPQAISFQR
jgi:hypothetical protein